MREAFINHNFRQDSLALIETCNSIIDGLKRQGYNLTLRQLYYQLVARDLIPNNERMYKKLSRMVTKGREAGLISWNAIEDRNRECVTYYHNEDPTTALDGLDSHVSYDYWERQPYYVECWVEKDAQVGVIKRPSMRWHVPYMACKGYLSASEAYSAGKRYQSASMRGKKLVLLHLGDHDPSGLDMTRDNADRLNLFSRTYGVEVQRLALNMDQVEKYDPPPNPAKLSDSRAPEYVEQYGEESWELDALEPKVVDDLISAAIKELVDFNLWEEVQSQEEEEKEILAAISEIQEDVFKMAREHLDGMR